MPTPHWSQPDAPGRKREALTRKLLRNFRNGDAGSSDREALHGIVLRLIEIATRLSSENDLQVLLERIVTEARHLTASDGGSLYVVDKEELVFAVLQNDTLKARGNLPQIGEFRFPINKSSLAGLAATERKSLNIPDVRKTEHHHPEVDARYEYSTQSMLVVPMIAPKGNLVGVLQLINAKTPRGDVEEFDEGMVPYAEALASLAAVALENARLYNQMSTLFESLVRYSVRAIDARDPCTAGHSSRVASYSVKLARAMGFEGDGLKEMRLAGLLHDVGKIGVREHILTKADKIPADRMAAVEERFQVCTLSRELEFRREGAPDVEQRIEDMRAQLESDLHFIKSLQVPRRLDDADLERIRNISETVFVDPRGEARRLLDDYETEALLVTRGNLTKSERRHMEEHALHTHKLLSQLPFPANLSRVPQFASLHHEKLNGSGYPFGLKGDDIPLGSRIMAVADIYDSLMAEDRPYKPPLGEDKALAIIDDMVNCGELDPEVVRVLHELITQNAIGPKRPAAQARELNIHWADSGYTSVFEADTAGEGDTSTEPAE